MDIIDLELILKLSISAVLGLVIGVERELKRKPLGLKTSLVISIISCLITIVSIESAYTFPGSDDLRIQMDPLRLAAQIVSGIGFLGAGVILRRGNDRISGLTTAAMIWGAAGIGIAVGAGFYVEAAFGVLLLLLSVELIPIIVLKFGPKKLRKRELMLKIHINELGSVEHVMHKLEREKFAISHLRIKDILESNSQLLEIKTKVNMNRTVPEIYNFIKTIEDVKTVEIVS
ncbi:MgtC/SapB family protein [Sporosarcina sp. ACRSM]|nr:MgtC/SapB family protein [Sporosarcina sp. ACRSM]MCG7337427.1 MgtC/SapB family protein [Sporosarcina sp. ACRSM]